MRENPRRGLADLMRDPTGLPTLAATGHTESVPDPDVTFRHGLALMVAGLRVRHAELVRV